MVVDDGRKGRRPQSNFNHFEELVMNRFASIALCLSFSTTAVAGDREAVTSIRGESDTGATSAHAGIWPPLLPFA